MFFYKFVTKLHLERFSWVPCTPKGDSKGNGNFAAGPLLLLHLPAPYNGRHRHREGTSDGTGASQPVG